MGGPLGIALCFRGLHLASPSGPECGERAAGSSCETFSNPVFPRPGVRTNSMNWPVFRGKASRLQIWGESCRGVCRHLFRPHDWEVREACTEAPHRVWVRKGGAASNSRGEVHARKRGALCHQLVRRPEQDWSGEGLGIQGTRLAAHTEVQGRQDVNAQLRTTDLRSPRRECCYSCHFHLGCHRSPPGNLQNTNALSF